MLKRLFILLLLTSFSSSLFALSESIQIINNSKNITLTGGQLKHSIPVVSLSPTEIKPGQSGKLTVYTDGAIGGEYAKFIYTAKRKHQVIGKIEGVAQFTIPTEIADMPPLGANFTYDKAKNAFVFS